jgi:hypothetical protein
MAKIGNAAYDKALSQAAQTLLKQEVEPTS